LNNTQGKLIIFSAPSGSGKTTIIRYLLHEERLPVVFSVSATSRLPRPEEVNGKDYYFLTPKEFMEKINRCEFVEWEEVYRDLFYGTLRSELHRIWSHGKHVIFDVDVIGGLNIKKQYPDNSLLIFLKPPSLEVLKERLFKRGTETEETVCMRIEKATKELQLAEQFDAIIVNDDLQKTKQDAKERVCRFLNL
jgi:guanylate kinase